MHDLILNTLPVFFLNLSFNGITDAGIASLCKGIVGNQMIGELDLRGNLFTADGLQMILNAMQYNETLRAVDVSGNRVGDADLVAYVHGRQVKTAQPLPTLSMVLPAEEVADQFGANSILRRRNKKGQRFVFLSVMEMFHVKAKPSTHHLPYTEAEQGGEDRPVRHQRAGRRSPDQTLQDLAQRT